MADSRIAGIVLMVVGAVLLVFGLNSSQSAPDQVVETVTGRFTSTTMWYILGGLGLFVGGGLLAFCCKKKE